MNEQKNLLRKIKIAINENITNETKLVDLLNVMIAVMQANIARACIQKEEYIMFLNHILENIEKSKKVSDSEWENIQTIINKEL